MSAAQICNRTRHACDYSILVGVVAFIMINAAIEYRLLCNQTRRVPTVLREKGYRFFFYMADRYEPPHIHVAKQDSAAKFWLDPLELEFNDGFHNHELSEIRRIIEAHMDDMRLAWYKSFGDRNLML